ncbi:MAG: hypothetical protein JRF33_10510 [Deltaproteobacteria bacterium]|nr:hypothetical protein [Deltaproteobacteria bacterium]
MKTLFLGLLLALVMTACGSDNSEDLCQATMTQLCDAACDCTSDESCALTAGQGFLIEFDNRDDCLGWYVGLVCPQADQAPEEFFETCSLALDSAGCETDPDESLLMPEACIVDD